MAKDFVKLSEVTVLEEVTDTASILVEQNGEIYRAPKTQVGGAGGIPVAIIKHSAYSDFLDYVLNSAPSPTSVTTEEFECINMSFQEAWDILSSGQPLTVIGLFPECGVCSSVMVSCVGPSYSYSGSREIGIVFAGKVSPDQLYWTDDRIFVLTQPE